MERPGLDSSGSNGDVSRTALSGREMVDLLRDQLKEKNEYANSMELEVRMLKETIKVVQEEALLRVTAEKAKAEEAREEAKRWKLEAFQNVQEASIMTSSEILETPECKQLQAEVKQLKKKVKAANEAQKNSMKETKEIRGQLSDSLARSNQLRQQVTSMEAEISSLKAREGGRTENASLEEMRRLKDEVDAAKRSLSALRKELATIKEELEEKDRQLAEAAAQEEKRLAEAAMSAAETKEAANDSASATAMCLGSSSAPVMPQGKAWEEVVHLEVDLGDEPRNFRGRSKSTMMESTSETELLQRDRSVLLQRIAELQEELGDMTQERDAALQEKARLLVMVTAMDEELDNVKSSSSAALAAVQFEHMDDSLHGQFDLPMGETEVASFTCANEKLLIGTWHLTQRYVCFGPNVLVRSRLNIFRSSETKADRAVIELVDITSLNLRKLQRWSRNGRAIEVTTASGLNLVFRGFRDRDGAVKAILDAASKLNHSIIVLNDGRPTKAYDRAA